MNGTTNVISGRVLGKSGTPVAGATVAIVGGEQPHRDIAVMTGPDGGFRLGGLMPGRYRVQARVRGITASADVVVAAGTPAQVEIRLDE